MTSGDNGPHLLCGFCAPGMTSLKHKYLHKHLVFGMCSSKPCSAGVPPNPHKNLGGSFLLLFCFNDPFLQMRTLRLCEVTGPARGHTAQRGPAGRRL